ncbi:hypothetical protein PHISCL_02776 [Aspergillus sclerotialis]|uniref:Uncharacterized protein n=1 Tax=Aspergillus sclerotialis TaxID=2070753 RepID=A0A3A2ZNR0_9EURO|nr:hypothetical protein PHISCL_02776 [Aspergillus sclerotialis]
MAFWTGWAMWQRVTLVVVLIYSFGVLLYNRRATKKHAEAEESEEKAEQETEMHPMLNDPSEIPFGARALERGIQVDGIWVSNNNTPLPSPQQPGTPAVSRPSSPTPESPLKQAPVMAASNAQIHSGVHPVTFSIKSPQAHRSPRASDDNAARYSRRESLHHGPFRGNQYPRFVVAGHNESHGANSPDLHPPKKHHRTSWFGKSPEAHYKRKSVIDGHLRRRSSEEFRRRMSKLFDENVQTRPMETFQLNPLHITPTNYKRYSTTGPPPP